MGVNAQTSVPVFTSGQILTAAQMTQVNTGIPVFATTTTRDAAFGGTGEKTLAQGQYAYIEATSSLQVYTGSAWTTLGNSGLTSIVPTSVTVGSGSASTSANGTVTFTGASTVTLNGIFSSTYENYLILLRPTASSINTDIWVRMTAAGTPNSTASSYFDQYIQAAGTTAASVGSNTTYWVPMGNYGSSYSTFASNTMSMFGPFLAQATVATSQSIHQAGSSGQWRYEAFGHVHNVATSYDGVQYIANGGNITGKVSVYGMAS